MEIFVETLKSQMKTIFQDIPEYFEDSPVSLIFLIILLTVFVLNIIKKIIINLEKRRGTLYQSCEYFVSENGQDCTNPSYRKRFKKKGDSCEKCPGRSFKITDDEAERRMANGAVWKRILLILSNGSKSILPYISFLYTLIVAILENSK